MAHARGVVVALGLLVITLIGCVPLLPVALVKPLATRQSWVSRAAIAIAWNWARACNAWILRISGTRVTYRQDCADDPQGRYVLVSNHQCWADAMLAVHVLDGRFAFPRFCLKRSLRWIPIVGLAFWALDYVFVTRYSAAALQADPTRRGQDVAAIQKACAVFRTRPVTLVNYPEGTRSTAAKRASRSSPYATLLAPKAGGFAFALHGLGDKLDGVLDLGVAYGDTPAPSFWALLCGRIPSVALWLRAPEVPSDVACGDYATDVDYRQRVKTFLNSLWSDKDPVIAAIQDSAHPNADFASMLDENQSNARD